HRVASRRPAGRRFRVDAKARGGPSPDLRRCRSDGDGGVGNACAPRPGQRRALASPRPASAPRDSARAECARDRRAGPHRRAGAHGRTEVFLPVAVTQCSPVSPSDPHQVLIVDDCESNLVLYDALLSRAGYAVRRANNGPEALEAVSASRPALLLLDYMMPGMNGGEVIRRLRGKRDTEHLPIIVLTASVASDDIDTALAAGANDYINKPVDSRILLTRIKSMIQAQ